jgi:hypothetical protein
MNHDNQSKNPDPLDPELEARVVAWVAGELPPAEVTELEQLVAASPALARFKRRMEAVQDLIAEAERADSAPLRLSLERRAKLLRALGAAESAEAPSRDNVVALPTMPSRWSWRRPQLYFSTAGMAAACLAVLFVWEKQQTPMYEATAEIHFKKKEPVQLQQAVADHAIRSNPDGLEVIIPGLEEAQRKTEAEMKGLLSKREAGRQDLSPPPEPAKSAPARLAEAPTFTTSAPPGTVTTGGVIPFNPIPAPVPSAPPSADSLREQLSQMPLQRTITSRDAYASTTPPASASKTRKREALADAKDDEARQRGLAGVGDARGISDTYKVDLDANRTSGPAPSSPVRVNLDGVPLTGGGLNITTTGGNIRLSEAGSKKETPNAIVSASAGKTNTATPAGLKVYDNTAVTPAGMRIVLTNSGNNFGGLTVTSTTGNLSAPAAEGLASAQPTFGLAPVITPFPAEKAAAEAPITLQAFSVDSRPAGAKAKASNRPSKPESKQDYVKTTPSGADTGKYTFINGDFADEPRKDAPVQTATGTISSTATLDASLLPGGPLMSIFQEQPHSFTGAGSLIFGSGSTPKSPSLALGAIPPLLPNPALLNEAGTAPDAAASATEQDKPRAKLATPPPAPTLEETATAREPVSTFSLHVSDVSFRLAQAALARGELPDASRIRAEEFYNAFDYGDPKPAVSEKVGARIEQGGHPFLPQRNLVRVALRVPANGRGTGTPLRLTVLLDTSGSMERDDRAAAVRRALEVLVSLLGPEDRLTLIGFAREPHLLAENLPGDRARSALDLLARTPAEGGTNLEAALKLGGELAQRYRTPGAQNRLVLLTDGAANLGNADPAQLGRAVETLRQQGLAFDACGVGLDGLDDEVLESLTRRGDGRYYALNSAADAEAGFAQKLAGAFRPAAENVKVQVRFNPARVGHYRLIGFEQHRLSEEDFRNDKVDAAELAAEEAAVALYQVELLPTGEGELGELFVRFRDPSTSQMVERQWTLPYDPAAPAFDRASPSLQLAGSAAFLAEKLRGGPGAATISLRELAPVAATLRGRYPQDARVQEFFTMIGQARRLLGDSP